MGILNEPLAKSPISPIYLIFDSKISKQTDKKPKTVLSLWINFPWKTTFTIFWIIQWVPRVHKASEGSFIALLNKYSCFNGRLSRASFICNDHAQASGQVWVKSQKRMWGEGTSFTNEREGHPDDEEIAQKTARPCGFYTWSQQVFEEQLLAGRRAGLDPFFPCVFWRTGWQRLQISQ